MKKKTLNFLLTGSLLTVVATASAQLAPNSQEGDAPRPPQEQQRSAPPQGQPGGQPEASQEPQQDPAEVQAKLEELHVELEKISERLNEIHQEALLNADVRDLLIDYESTLNEKIADTAPGLEDQVEAHEELLQEISEIDGSGDDLSAEEGEQLEALLTQHSELKQQLAPIENQLLNDPEMRESRTEYQEELISAMNEVDPEVEAIIEERMELAQNFMALQQELVQSQQPEGGAPQPQGQQPQGQQGQSPRSGGQGPGAR